MLNFKISKTVLINIINVDLFNRILSLVLNLKSDPLLFYLFTYYFSPKH